MKNKLIILSILPLLTSCSGLPISREDALNVLQNIEKEYVSLTSTSYFVSSKTTTDENETEAYYIYSKENKFYHTYTISTQSTGRIGESWKFKQTYKYETNDSTEDFIFTITRIITPQNLHDLEKQYVVTYEKYSDEAWQKVANEYEDRLARRYSDVIEHSRELIKDVSNPIDLKSMNSNSLFLKSNESVVGAETQTNEYEISISNNILNYIKTISGKTIVETNFKYASGDIIYPSYKITIPYNN